MLNGVLLDGRLTVAPHPLLSLAAFEATFAVPLVELPISPEVDRLLDAPGREGPAGAAFFIDDVVRGAIRDVLRAGGFKPTGRNKPSSEYLGAAVERGPMPRINLPVDAANAVSRHGGLPISVVDADRLEGAAVVRNGTAGESYVFNASGQVIDVEGLVGLADALGACANAVKDAHRTKTHAGTRRVWTLVWGSRALTSQGQPTSVALATWMASLIAASGATVSAVHAWPAS